MAVSLQNILERQRKDLEVLLSQQLIEREIKGDLKISQGSLAKVIIGIRRSGKSTLATIMLKGTKFGYANFDERGLVNIELDELLSAIRETYGSIKVLFLDEIQNVDGWELWVNSLQRQGYALVITGSNAKLLSKELSTHLTGRHTKLEVFPFSFSEFLRYKKFETLEIGRLKEKEGEAKNLLREYIEKGAFPEIVSKGLGPEYLKTLANDILYKDVVLRWNIRYPKVLEDLVGYLASQCSCEFSYNKLRNVLGFRSVPTVQNYCKHLTEAYLFFYLDRFSYKAKERVNAPKKAYCIDTGLVNAVGIKFSREMGKLIENLVFLEIRRRGFVENERLFYYKDYQGREVDFLLKEGTLISKLIQVTYASKRDEVNKREIDSLLRASRELGCNDLTVITWEYEAVEMIDGRKIVFTPLWLFLLGGVAGQTKLV